MKRILTSIVLLAAFVAVPLAGVLLRGGSPGSYLSFPPVTTELAVSSFSWVAFLAVMLFVIITTWPFWRRMTNGGWSTGPSHGRFPRWGRVAFAGLIVFWILAWTRFTWFEPMQRLTFFPLWFCFIILLNAMAVRISGKSLMTGRPIFFSLLFPTSALFWWTFEYLNRFTNNWYYIGTAEIGEWQYFAEASLAFSTVLPAVLSVRFLLMQTETFSTGYRDFSRLPWATSNIFRNTAGVLSLLALVILGWKPEFSYPLIWIVPGLLWIVYQQWNDYSDPLIKQVSKGDFTLVWSSACAALICGFFWEMWNIYSEAKWIYSIPALDRFHLFEMPLAGYAGYLPFGVICALVSNSLLDTITGGEQPAEAE